MNHLLSAVTVASERTNLHSALGTPLYAPVITMKAVCGETAVLRNATEVELPTLRFLTALEPWPAPPEPSCDRCRARWELEQVVSDKRKEQGGTEAAPP